MESTLSTTGYVLHNLGLATGFGGTLFGRLALDPSTRVLSKPEERGKITNKAWNVFNLVNSFGMGLTALTWFLGRSRLSGRAVDRATQRAVVAKDVFLLSSIATGIASMIGGIYLTRQAPEGAVPIESGVVPGPETPPSAAKTQRMLNVLGFVNLACNAAVIGLSTFLDMRAGRSLRWKAVARMLP